MRCNSIIAVCATALAITLPGAAPVSANERRSVSGWNISESRFSCSMYRNQASSFTFLWLDPNGIPYLRAHRSDWQKAARQNLVTMKFGERQLEAASTAAVTANGWNGVIIKLSPEMLGEIKRNSSLVISVVGGADYPVKFDGAAEAINAIGECHMNAVAAMPLELKHAKSRPIPIGTNWISMSDYPRAALSHGQSGAVGFQLSIDREGKPKACKILKSSNFTDLDDATCKLLLERAKFRPALADDGTAIPDTFQSSVKWTLP